MTGSGVELLRARLRDTPTLRFVEAVLGNPSWVLVYAAGCEADVGCVSALTGAAPMEKLLVIIAELYALLERGNKVEHGPVTVRVEKAEISGGVIHVHTTLMPDGWHLAIAVKRRHSRLDYTVSMFT